MTQIQLEANKQSRRKTIAVAVIAIFGSVLLYAPFMLLAALFLWAIADLSHYGYSYNLVNGHMFALSAFYMGYMIARTVTRSHIKLVIAGLVLFFILITALTSGGFGAYYFAPVRHLSFNVFASPLLLTLSACLGVIYGFKHRIPLRAFLASLFSLYIVYHLAEIYDLFFGYIHLLWLAAVCASLGAANQSEIYRWSFYFSALFAANHIAAYIYNILEPWPGSDPRAYALPGQNISEFSFPYGKIEIYDSWNLAFTLLVFAVIFVFCTLSGLIGAALSVNFKRGEKENSAQKPAT